MLFSPWKDGRPTVVAGLMSALRLTASMRPSSAYTAGFEASVELAHYYNKPYEPELRQRRAICAVRRIPTARCLQYECILGVSVWAAVLEAVADAGMRIDEVDLISSHGQTIWHQPIPEQGDPYAVASTLQIGDISVIAKHTANLR